MVDRFHNSDVTTAIRTKDYANIWVDLKKSVSIASLEDFEIFTCSLLRIFSDLEWFRNVMVQQNVNILQIKVQISDKTVFNDGDTVGNHIIHQAKRQLKQNL